MAEIAEKKKPGRKPMTVTEKKAAQRRINKEKKIAENMEPQVVVQFQGMDIDVNALAEAARADFKASHKRVRVLSLRLYVKPEERAAYYVVNDTYEGRLGY